MKKLNFVMARAPSFLRNVRDAVPMPAQFTLMSILPKSEATASTTAWIDPLSVTLTKSGARLIAEFTRGLLGERFAEIEDRDFAAVLDDHFSGCATWTGCAAGSDCNLVGYVHVDVPCLLSRTVMRPAL